MGPWVNLSKFVGQYFHLTLCKQHFLIGIISLLCLSFQCYDIIPPPPATPFLPGLGSLRNMPGYLFLKNPSPGSYEHHEPLRPHQGSSVPLLDNSPISHRENITKKTLWPPIYFCFLPVLYFNDESSEISREKGWRASTHSFPGYLWGVADQTVAFCPVPWPSPFCTYNFLFSLPSSPSPAIT